MSLIDEQIGVFKGMSLALLITSATIFFSVKLLGPKFIVLSLGGRYALCALSILLPALILAFSIGRLAKHRFFSGQDIDGSALTRGTSMAVLLQAMLQNTLEQSVLALFAYASWCLLVPSQLLPAAPAAAMLFLVGRVLFFTAYVQGAKARALGFALTFYPTLMLLVGSAYFALTAVLAMVNPS
jgi:uncharacterized MAPEG superfamily protein